MKRPPPSLREPFPWNPVFLFENFPQMIIKHYYDFHYDDHAENFKYGDDDDGVDDGDDGGGCDGGTNLLFSPGSTFLTRNVGRVGREVPIAHEKK